MTMKVKSDIKIVENDGKKGDYTHPLSVESHEGNPKLVVLRGIGNHFAVVAEDLKRAIENATNSGERR